MKKLNTIQTREKFNDVFAVDEPGPGGAHHRYEICKSGTARINEADNVLQVSPEDLVGVVQLQCGARKDPEALTGAGNCDLLEIVRDQLIAFQSGPFNCAENEHALKHVEAALEWLNRRVEDRIARGVLGTEQK